MRKRLRNYKITHVEKTHQGMMILRDARGSSFQVKKSQIHQRLLPNFLLKFKPAELMVTYIYGTDIILQMNLNQQIIYHQPEKNFPEWETFFKTYKGLEAEIELAIGRYDNHEGLLLYNLHNQELDVFRFRQEILLTYYQQAIPNLVSRLKIENDLVFALKKFRASCIDVPDKRNSLINILKTKTNVPLEFPLLTEWCLDEIEMLENLYQIDQDVTLTYLTDSKVIGHSSLLIPVNISNDKIMEFINSLEKREQVS